MKKLIRIATRKSPLALWQANHIREALLQYWPELDIELLPMVTSGDQFNKNKLQDLGGKGLFVKELEEALLDKRADLAVHSMKDVPAVFPEGLSLAAICARANPLDALVSQGSCTLERLPRGAVIGTSSLRRQAQLLAVRPDLTIKVLRGNIQTRIHKAQLGEYDAIVLAVAGLERLGLDGIISEILTTEVMLPACGQGALGIECRENDEEVKKYIMPLADPLTGLCVNSERRVNELLGGNCHVPLAVYCQQLADGELLLRAKVATMDGKIVISNSQQGSPQDARSLAEACAQGMLESGAGDLLLAAHS